MVLCYFQAYYNKKEGCLTPSKRVNILGAWSAWGKQSPDLCRLKFWASFSLQGGLEMPKDKHA